MSNNRRTLCVIRMALVVVCSWAFGWEAIAFDAPKWSLAKKAEYSDLVIVGRVIRLQPHRIEDGKFSFESKSAFVEVTAILKGDPPKNVEIYYYGPAPEDNPNCCDVGKSYVFFLKRARNSTFDTVNSRYGVYPILSESVATSDKP